MYFSVWVDDVNFQLVLLKVIVIVVVVEGLRKEKSEVYKQVEVPRD